MVFMSFESADFVGAESARRFLAPEVPGHQYFNEALVESGAGMAQVSKDLAGALENELPEIVDDPAVGYLLVAYARNTVEHLTTVSSWLTMWVREVSEDTEDRLGFADRLGVDEFEVPNLRRDQVAAAVDRLRSATQGLSAAYVALAHAATDLGHLHRND
ncbi:hypothetical protein ACFYTQ_31640 [Nocardia sp. NPDC004068]|uniref:hypothetical protein n=1 Tax=Nocardia sp. NPDC004068 TaxID=3364303 RepID=UPI0036B83F33